MPSLYANLLDPKVKAATISGAPVKYEFKKSDEPTEEERKPDAPLRFQPVKRPQAAQRPKPRPSAATSASSKQSDNAEPEKKAAPSLVQNNSTFERWTANAEDDYDEDPYAAEYLRRMDEQKQRQRGRKNKKKNKGERYVDWDRPYDPERPTRLDEYRGSEEQVQAAHEWKMRLHAHHLRKKRRVTESESEDDGSRKPQRAFAPPSNYNFAPPVQDDVVQRPSASLGNLASSEPPEGEELPDEQPYVPPAPAAHVPDDASGDDAYLRRMQMAAAATAARPQPPPPTAFVQPHDSVIQDGETQAMPLPDFAPAPGVGPSPLPRGLNTSAQSSNIVFSSAPVRYDQRAPPAASSFDMPQQPASGDGRREGDPASDENTEDLPRSKRPGQKGFAKRLLQRYGWQEGQGLGATGTGITTILQHQKGKRKKRPDAEGGGWLGPAGGVARIVGGKRQKTTGGGEGEEGVGSGVDGDGADTGTELQWSIVAVFRGMLAGVDVQAEMEHGSLMQDIGDTMAKYGIVERLFLDRQETPDGLGTAVFVKFTSALSAYRAIQASNGQDFLSNGRTVQSSFFDEERFENGVYE